MTLYELLTELNIDVACPYELGTLTIDNPDQFCRYALKNFFLSKSFQKDLEKCKQDFHYVANLGYPCSLHLQRNKEKVFSLSLYIDCHKQPY